MKVYYSAILDPYVNLSIEKWLLKRTDLKGKEVLLFYRNAPSVILGRFQNPWLECDLPKMAERQIKLVRRESGGGTVYHDPGNLNFTFFSDKDDMDREKRTAIVTEALKSLNIHAFQGKRNDIYVDGKKISGSAGKYTSTRALHHGTLLINADLEALNNYLLAEDYNSKDLKSRGTASIPSEVTNLSEYNETINHSEIIDAISDCASRFAGSPVERITLDTVDLEGIDEIEEYRSILAGWDWIFGKTPSFAITLTVDASGAKQKCQFSINKGLVKDISFDGDCPDQEIRREMEKAYLGQPFDQLVNFRGKSAND